MLQILQEHTLSDEDRRKLLDLDVRAKEALEQMGLDTRRPSKAWRRVASASERSCCERARAKSDGSTAGRRCSVP